VVALIGEFPSPRRAFVVDHWEPGPSDADLSVLKSSPAREALKAALANRWAAILYAPGAGQAPAAVEAAFQAIEKKWAQDQPPGVSVVRFDRADPQERLLCTFAGIEPSGSDWAGVVFGRGKLMAPPLQDGEITEGNLTQLLQRLAVLCTCLQQSITLGLDIPMTWEPALDAKVPMGVPSQGYVEMALDKPAAPIGMASLMDDIPQEDRHVVATAVVPLACAGGVAGVAIALVIWRARRRNPKLLEDRCAIE
jgi:hypothetical protein